MRRRLVRLVVLAVVVPAAARGAELVADRLESSNGPSLVTRSLRQAGHLAARRRQD